ncbi:MAG: hypothetical protein HAW67_03410 [Endozoicomonadaceae bacterium]|nr:hypothetical protein [Endozoicomonadaceae bacterium]
MFEIKDNLDDTIQSLIELGEKVNHHAFYKMVFRNRYEIDSKFGEEAAAKAFGELHYFYTDSDSVPLVSFLHKKLEQSKGNPFAKQLIDEYKKSSILLLRRDERVYSIAPNAQDNNVKYPIQLSVFRMDHGAIGDSSHASLEEALGSFNVWEWELIPEEEIEAIENNLVESEARWQRNAAAYMKSHMRLK